MEAKHDVNVDSRWRRVRDVTLVYGPVALIVAGGAVAWQMLFGWWI